MSDKNKKRLLIGGGVVALIIWLLFSRGGQVLMGGALPGLSGPGGININRRDPYTPGSINIPPPWTPPARPCKCGCDEYGVRFGNMMSMPPESMAAMMGVF